MLIIYDIFNFKPILTFLQTERFKIKFFDQPACAPLLACT